MSDRRWRARARAASGDPQEEAEVLAMALRQGSLDPQALALAAYLEHPPALLTLGPRAPHRPSSLESWLRGLGPWGPRVWGRAAAAALGLVIPLWEARHSDPRPRQAAEALTTWLGAPTPAHAEAASAAGEACYLILGEEAPGSARPGSRSPAEERALAFRETRACALGAACVVDPPQGLRHAVLAAVATRERLALEEVGPGAGGQGLFRRAAEVDRLGHLPELNTQESELRLRGEVRARVLPYALRALQGEPG